jgi:flagella basal body P-ring formation protein FlgA
MKFVTLFTLLFSVSIFSCEVELYPYSLVFDSNDMQGIVKKTTCSKEKLQIITKSLKQLEGNIPTLYLSSEIKVTPKSIKIDLAKSLMQSLVSEEQKFSEVKKDNYYSENEITWSISCKSCNSKLGSVLVKLESPQKTFYLNPKLLSSKKVLVLKEHINSLTETLNHHSVEEKFVFTDRPESFFEDREALKFYKTTRKLNEGHQIRKTDLRPLNLVKRNKLVNVLIQGSNLELKTQAISKQSGKYGDFINLKNTKTKKIFTGKVIDYNQVRVDL